MSAWSEEVSATTGDASGACREGGEYLCLSEGRFEIRAHWKDHNREGVYGTGTATPIDVSDESGMFWFFSSSNIELVVKALDGRGINGHYWVFFGALSDVEYWVTVRDTVGGGRRTYHNPPAENCGQSDITGVRSVRGPPRPPPPGTPGTPGRRASNWFRLRAWSSDLSAVRAGAGPAAEPANPPAGRLCLHDGRFSVEVEFTDPNVNETKAGQVGLVADDPGRPGSSGSSARPTWSWRAKVLDGRAP